VGRLVAGTAFLTVVAVGLMGFGADAVRTEVRGATAEAQTATSDAPAALSSIAGVDPTSGVSMPAPPSSVAPSTPAPAPVPATSAPAAPGALAPPTGTTIAAPSVAAALQAAADVPVGCPSAAPAAAGSTVAVTLASGGRERALRLRLPSGYRPDRTWPLVLVFHGFGGSAESAQAGFGFDRIADAQGVVVAYPQGTDSGTGGKGWSTFGRRAGAAGVDDVVFVRDALDLVGTRVCVDTRRVFATGMSNGGGMAALLACRLADRVAAVAPVAGAYYPIPGGCRPSRPVAVLAFHGAGDVVVPFAGDPAWALPPVAEWTRGWAERNGCRGDKAVFLQVPGASGEGWNDCQAGAQVGTIRLEAFGHNWPVGPPQSVRNAGVDAADTIWGFFAHHPGPGA